MVVMMHMVYSFLGCRSPCCRKRCFVTVNKDADCCCVTGSRSASQRCCIVGHNWSGTKTKCEGGYTQKTIGSGRNGMSHDGVQIQKKTEYTYSLDEFKYLRCIRHRCEPSRLGWVKLVDRWGAKISSTRPPRPTNTFKSQHVFWCTSNIALWNPFPPSSFGFVGNNIAKFPGLLELTDSWSDFNGRRNNKACFVTAFSCLVCSFCLVVLALWLSWSQATMIPGRWHPWR